MTRPSAFPYAVAAAFLVVLEAFLVYEAAAG
jgi:hypothetical protein